MHDRIHSWRNVVYLKELPLRFEGHTIDTVPTRLLWVENKLLLAIIAVTEVTDQHIDKMRWSLQELGAPLGLIANFYPSRLAVKFVRIGGTTADLENNR